MIRPSTPGELVVRLRDLGVSLRNSRERGGNALPNPPASLPRALFWSAREEDNVAVWFGHVGEDGAFRSVYSASFLPRAVPPNLARLRTAVRFFRATRAAVSLSEISFFLGRLGVLGEGREWSRPLFRTYREPYAEYLAAWDPKKRLFVLGVRFDVSPLTWPKPRQSENSQKNGVPRST